MRPSSFARFGNAFSEARRPAAFCSRLVVSHPLPPSLDAAMGILEKIESITEELKRTQVNKATEYHVGLQKAKLARYRAELLEPEKKKRAGEGFDVSKAGYGRVALVGFPSVRTHDSGVPLIASRSARVRCSRS